MKRYTLITMVAAVLSNSLSAQNINTNILAGSWLGKINTGAMSLRIIFNISQAENDSLVATPDSPDQGAKNIPLGKVILKDKQLIIEAPALTGEYKGIITSDSTIDGTWTQGGAKFNIILTKLTKNLVITRPQEPKPPFPYTSEDVKFTNEKFNISLAGTLTFPSGPGPFKTVVMITGSGAQNRNEELMGHKPFLVIADYLSRNGIAVLRYDDRGVGGSQGKYSEATSADLATDVEAAINYLKNNPKINQHEIGLIGHSEGGLIASIVASTNHNIGFIVSLAGPGINGEEIILRQTRDISQISGLDETHVKEATEINKKLYDVLKKEKNNDKAEIKILALYKELLKQNKTSDGDAENAVNQMKYSFGANRYTWFRYFIMTDPTKYWKKVKCPVLALDGEKDLQVAATLNIPAIEKAVRASGNKSVKTLIFPDLNHLFQHCKTGLPAEYNSIEETFSPEVLKTMADWILAL